jgi:phytoene synthase
MAWPSGGTPAVQDEISTFDNDARYCRELTRREAANFYWGFVALPRAQRTAIYALYSFAREVDDDADSSAGKSEVELFLHHRERIRRCFQGDPGDPVMRVLAHTVSRYCIPQLDLEALIDGVEMDLRVTRYETWSDVREYCRLVASTIGRMCVRIFGFSDPVAIELGDELGVAMQLANILRDVREDASLGRVYLPQTDMRSFGVSETVLSGGRSCREWEALVRFEIERARGLFDSGLQVTQLIPRRAAACVLTMSGIYRAILAEIERDPCLPLRGRARLSGREKLAVMMRSWLQAA